MFSIVFFVSDGSESSGRLSDKEKMFIITTNDMQGKLTGVLFTSISYFTTHTVIF